MSNLIKIKDKIVRDYFTFEHDIFGNDDYNSAYLSHSRHGIGIHY